MYACVCPSIHACSYMSTRPYAPHEHPDNSNECPRALANPFAAACLATQGPIGTGVGGRLGRRSGAVRFAPLLAGFLPVFVHGLLPNMQLQRRTPRRRDAPLGAPRPWCRPCRHPFAAAPRSARGLHTDLAHLVPHVRCHLAARLSRPASGHARCPSFARYLSM